MKTPLVSVCVVTYNQEAVLRNCLESIVAQEADFKFEVIVFDDASTDATPEIIKEFTLKYSFVRAVLRNKNVGAFQNFIECHSSSTAKLVCHCDGDDYWLPGKLKKQVDYMSKHPECNILWHKVKLLDSQGNLREDNLRKEILSKHFDKYDLSALGTIGVHSSKMYRKRGQFNDIEGVPCIDYALNIIDVHDGYAKILDSEALGVYRLGIGVSSSGLKTKVLYTKCYKALVKRDKRLKKYFVANALVKVIAALKNFRIREALIFIPTIIDVSVLSAIFYVIRNRNVIKMASLR